MVQPLTMNWLLQLLGARIEGDTSLTNVALTFRQATDPVFLAIIGIALIALAVWAYRFLSEELTGWRTSLLAGLRIAFFLLVLALLLRPTLALTLEGRVRRTLVMLFDGSGSMGIRDGEATRLENVKTALAKEHINLRRLQHHYDLAPFQFGKELQELVSSNQTDWVTLLNTNSPVSAVGDAVREVISRKRGQPLAGILLLTDGANNAGSSPRETAVLAGEEGVPLYIHGVGREIPKDIIISSVFAQELAFAEDEVAVTVRVRGQGVAGRTARLTLSLG
jgi:hypothetical protein